MKLHITNYSFNASARQVTFRDYAATGISLDSILLITNTTANVIIYNFADPTAGGTVSGNVLTLTYNTTAMNNTDKLMIYYDDANIPVKDSTLQLLENQNDLLRRMVKLLESQGTVDSFNRQRVTVDSWAYAPPISVSGSLTASIVPNLTPVYVTGSVTASIAVAPQLGNVYASSTSPYVLTSFGALPITEYPVGQEWRVADSARNTFANGIRPNIK